METTPFYVLVFIHLSGLILGFGSVLVTDLYGLLRVWNRVRFPQLIGVNGVVLYFLNEQVEGCKEGDDAPKIVIFRL